MTEYRDMAHAVERIQQQELAERSAMSATEDQEKLENVRARLGVGPVTEHAIPLQERQETNIKLQLKLTENILASGISEELQEADDEKLFEEQQRLSALPYIGGEAVTDLTTVKGKDKGVWFVPTDKIVGSVSLDVHDWSSEYERRKGRVMEIAKSLRAGDETDIEEVFHLQKPSEQIKVKEIEAPDGSLYIVQDGTHRVASVKLLGIPKIPVRVESRGTLTESYTEDVMLSNEWRERINRGLMEGDIEQINVSGRTTYKLNIKSQQLPWMHLPTAKLLQMSRIYNSLYPHALEQINIPPKALTNIVGYQAYIAGRFNKLEAL